MPLISLCINVDTRNKKNQNDGLFNGAVNIDFLTDGVFNKIKFFAGFDIETIVFIDEHNPVDEKTLSYLRHICDTVVIRKHTNEEKFNDYNYLSTLSLCRGEYICHIDGDMACFTENKEPIQRMIGWLEEYDFVSYPWLHSPNPDVNPNYDYWWCSTRFFMCKKESLDITEIRKCLQDSDYLYGKYPASVRNPWLEHILGLYAKYNGKKKGVFYPPLDFSTHIIFCWNNYDDYILRRLNELSYQEVINWVATKQYHYPCDLTI